MLPTNFKWIVLDALTLLKAHSISAEASAMGPARFAMVNMTSNLVNNQQKADHRTLRMYVTVGTSEGGRREYCSDQYPRNHPWKRARNVPSDTEVIIAIHIRGPPIALM